MKRTIDVFFSMPYSTGGCYGSTLYLNELNSLIKRLRCQFLAFEYLSAIEVAEVSSAVWADLDLKIYQYSSIICPGVRNASKESLAKYAFRPDEKERLSGNSRINH